MAKPPRVRYRPLHSPNHLLALAVITLISVVLCWLALGDKLDFMDIYLGAAGDEGRHAFATVLLPPPNNSNDSHDVDHYLTSTRMLNYQLKHDKNTRSRGDIPFLAVVAPDILPWKRKLLEREGATVIFAERISLGDEWIEPMTERWKDVMLKLRLFELIDYDKILFLDADTYLLKPLDRIFRDPAARPIRTGTSEKETRPDEASLPETYLFATGPEIMHTSHPWPPHPWPRFNAGFFLFQPSKELFKYYTSLLTLKDRFDSTYPEQNLLNYAHREWGNMPWARLKTGWNVNLPNMNDVRKGVKSVHAKLWMKGHELQPVPEELRRMWEKTKVEMESFYNKIGFKLR
ncbi:nucleotide-diphospho-sugar transferase [Cadophora sp. MPI-SDFR-AT-0126]|nr:nucleotide-diphospho-sugar transferase [Leotiomycetes sp. MPI-SDFR-AT-0126]